MLVHLRVALLVIIEIQALAFIFFVTGRKKREGNRLQKIRSEKMA
jgi:hypothetical protein